MSSRPNKVKLGAFLKPVFGIMDKTEEMRTKQRRPDPYQKAESEFTIDEKLTSILKSNLEEQMEGLPEQHLNLLQRHHNLICSPWFYDWPTYFFKLRQEIESGLLELSWHSLEKRILEMEKTKEPGKDDPDLIAYLEENAADIDEKAIIESRASLQAVNDLNEFVKICNSRGVKFDHEVWQSVSKENPGLSMDVLFEKYVHALEKKSPGLICEDANAQTATNNRQSNSLGRPESQAEKDKVIFKDAVRLIILLAKDLKGGEWYVKVMHSNRTKSGSNRWAAAWDFVKKEMKSIPESIIKAFSEEGQALLDEADCREVYLKKCYSSNFKPYYLTPRKGDTNKEPEENWETFRSRLITAEWLTDSELRLVTPESGPRSGGDLGG